MAEVTGVLGGVGNGNHTFRPNTRVWAGGYAPDPGPTQFLAASNYPVGTLVYLEDTLLNAGAVYRADVVKPANVLFDPSDWTIVGRYWRADEPFLTTTGTVTANSTTVITNQLQVSGGATGGTQTFIDTDVQWAVTGGATAGGGNAATSRTFRRSNLILDRTAYTLLGNWSNRATNPTWILDDFVMSGLVDETFAAVGASLFTGAISNTSSFNNVAFWNGIDLGDGARGGVWQTTTGQIYNNSLLGPFGNQLNSTATSRMIARFANQGNNPLTQASHTGLATNYDFRALSQISPATGLNTTNWFIDVDTAGHIAFLNWLPGAATGVNNFGFTNIFNSATNTGGQAHVLVGTNQQPGDGDHIYTVTDADIDAGMLLLNGAWDVNTSLTNATGVNNAAAGWIADDTRILTNPTGALVWRNQHYNQSTLTDNTGHVTRLVDFTDLSEKSYRKYSWLQQPDQATWGRLVTVSVPPNGASDPQVATARAGGYDIHNGTAWETSTDISDPVDLITSQTAIDTPAKAATLFAAGGTTSSHVVAGAKLQARANVTDANVGATNTLVPVDYGISATTVTFGVPLSIGSGVTSSKGAGGYTIRNSSITADDFITNINSSVITLTGTTVNGTDDKAVLEGTALGNALVGTSLTINTLEASAPSGNIDFTGSSISNSELMCGGTFNAANITGGSLMATGNVTITGNLDDTTITSQGTLTFGGNNVLTSPCNLTASSFISLQSTAATRETFVGHTFNGNYTFTTSNPTLEDVTWSGGTPTFIASTDLANSLILSGTTDLSAVQSSLVGAVQYQLRDGATEASVFGAAGKPAAWIDVTANNITIEGTLAEIRARGGYFNVVEVATGNSVLPGNGVLEITNSTTMAQMTAIKRDTTGTYRAIYKPTTVFGGTGVGIAYQTTIIDYDNLTTDVLVPFSTHSTLVTEGSLPAGPPAGVAGNPLAVFSLIGEVGENDIVGDGTTNTNEFTNAAGTPSNAVAVERVISVTGGVTTELTRDDGGAAGTYTLVEDTRGGAFAGTFTDIIINGGNVPTGTTIRIFFSIGDERAMRITLRAAGNSLTAIETQALSLAAANTEQYVQIHSDYSIFWDTEEMFAPGPDARSVWTGQAQGTEWLSGDPTTAQQRVSNLEGLISGTAGTAGAIFDQVINIPSVSASLSTVAAAVSSIVGEELMDILENQVAVVNNQNNMQTAIQRGAVKAATYSAGQLTTSTDNNFNNPTDDA